MPVTIRKCSPNDNVDSSPSSSGESRGHYSSVVDVVPCSSRSTAPTSLSDSPRLLDSKVMPSSSVPEATASLHSLPYPEQSRYEPCNKAAHAEDLSPSTLCYPRASVDSYTSEVDSELDRDEQLPDDASDLTDDDTESSHLCHGLNNSDGSIPPLPEYRHDIVDRNVCPSTPQEFAQLFPSLDRMSVRHDEFTSDGNMNLRIDVTVPVGSRRLLASYQLFHLRMHNLAKREFSLRRYSRDSGREVCNSKLALVGSTNSKHDVGKMSRKAREDTSKRHWGRSSSTSSSSGGNSAKADAADFWPALQRSMDKAFRSLSAMASMPAIRRSHTAYSSDRRPATSHSPYSRVQRNKKHTLTLSQRSRSISVPSLPGHDVHLSSTPKPANSIKLEFSNYARVDLERRDGHISIGHDNSRYEYEWWGHRYTWKRFVGKHLNVPSYHLLRDDNGDQPIAHIIPETRSPNQVDADELAGGWIPPCHMWIADPSVLTAQTDVADVIVSTGIIALVDDCIRMRWQSQKPHHSLNVPLISRTFDLDHVKPRALVQHVFHRRNSHGSGNNSSQIVSHVSSPLRYAERTY